MQTFTAVVEKDADWYCAYCPELGTVSQGKTRKVALKNLKEATDLYLEEFPRPKPKSFVSVFEVKSNVKASVWS